MHQSIRRSLRPVLNPKENTPEYKRKQNKVRLKGGRIKKVSQLSHLIILLILLQTTKANRPPRFIIESQSEIVLRLKESPETEVGKYKVENPHFKNLFMTIFSFKVP